MESQKELVEYLLRNNIKGKQEFRVHKYRVDFAIKTFWGYLFLEVDENQHSSYKHEYRRMHNIDDSIDKKVCWLRYNPNEYVVNDITYGTYTTRQRKRKLLQTIEKYLKVEPDIRYVFMFYDEDLKMPLSEYIF